MENRFQNSIAQFKFVLIALLVFASCKQEANKVETIEEVILWEPYNDSSEVAANAEHEVARMRYKLIQSKVWNKNDTFLPMHQEVSKMDSTTYTSLRPLILEQSIPVIQEHISNGKLSYEQLVLFYLHRIYKYELDNGTTLNTVIAINPKVLDEARALDANSEGHHPIYGMPILLKDNIGTDDMNTTAGAIALKDNLADDAFIVDRLKEKGALILGKVNLSEWAYFLCDGCPVGYSALWGQTLNPYGRRVFESGGSSSGSGTSVAANYAVAAVGTETSGSILSPSSQNSVVGLKPTIGLLSRTGIVPISSTLDTPGPMTKNVVDNAILLDAMMGYDKVDDASVLTGWEKDWYQTEEPSTLKGKRFGVFKNLMGRDSIYKATIEKIKEAGATVVEFEPPQVEMDGFLSILNIDMKNDLPAYIQNHVKDVQAVAVKDVADVVNFNLQDTLIRIPYGQARLDGILADSTSAEGLAEIKKRLQANGRKYFNEAMEAHDLDAILSINNYHAGFAAVAKYPALTIPMGYKPSGEPISLTFIAKQFQEAKLYDLGMAYENAIKVRKIPSGYKD
ncbi:amidase family protein [Flagellimonas meridianipacifica]|uniref:Amidase n=1 Tax=Flagellimonas meridianipacifica TaxID=1080225 RepID=A0A2T0M6T2_9FLAO|nr:amidase family protein [Allomuricauda pacifica]PRX53194.1 amidase [Allomuricauda pacifica]